MNEEDVFIEQVLNEKDPQNEDRELSMEEKNDFLSEFYKRINSIQPEIREYVLSPNYADDLTSVINKYNLDQEKATKLEYVTTLTLLGYFKPTEYKNILADSLKELNKNTIDGIYESIFIKVINKERKEILEYNWMDEDETEQIIQESIELALTPTPPGQIESKETIINNYINKKETEKDIIIPESIRPMVTKNEEIVSKMNQKPSENQATWEDRIALANTANPNITHRKSTDQTLPHISKLGGDAYREAIEE